jgi:nucleotide-binding universal stress UspA family protein
MFKSILVPTDGTPLSAVAVSKAIEFAKLNPDCQIVGITVAELMPFAAVEGVGLVDPDKYEKGMRDMAQKCVNKIDEAAKAAGIPCKTIVAQSSTPSEEILKAASDNGCDLIFMASHGRKGMNRVLLGSNTQKVLSESKIPVIVYRPEIAPEPGSGAQWDLMGF